MPAAGTLDLRRKAQIAQAKPTDHSRDVIVRRAKTFELDNTIFGSLDSSLARLATKDRLAIEVYWSDAAAASIQAAFSSLPAAPAHDQALLDFMSNECNFSMEHADGSFMDHLQFCYEYCAAHFKGCSPRVLLLHSIMGVGTNFFPMAVSGIPKLQTLVTEDEFRHIEAFPSVLRLLFHGPLLQELESYSGQKLVEALDGIRFNRVLDNKKLTINAADFWVQLNYQLIHLLDFLPVADWSMRMDDNFLELFVNLHKFLVGSGKLMAHVDFDISTAETAPVGSQPTTIVGYLMARLVPSALKRKLSQKAITRFSAQIGHSLDYELLWKPDSRL